MLCVALIVGMLTAIAGLRRGVFRWWIFFFNSIISIYLGIMLTPLITGLISADGVGRLVCSCCVGLVAFGVLGILQTIAIVFFPAGSEPVFPGMFNRIAGGLFGFLSGYFIAGFLLFLVYITPLSEQPFVKEFCDKKDVFSSIGGPVVQACDVVNMASLQFKRGQAEKIVNDIIHSGKDGIYNPHEAYKAGF